MIAAISLLALAGVIALAYFKKYNPGILGIAVAFILGFFVKNNGGAALSSAAGACSVIMNAFPTSFF